MQGEVFHVSWRKMAAWALALKTIISMWKDHAVWHESELLWVPVGKTAIMDNYVQALGEMPGVRIYV